MNNEFGVPNIGVFPSSVTNAGVGAGLTIMQPKRKVTINNIKFNMQ